MDDSATSLPLLKNKHAFSIYRNSAKVTAISTTILIFLLSTLVASFRLVALCLGLLALTSLLGLCCLHIFSRLILDTQGIRKEKLFGITPKCILWHQQTITTDQEGIYFVKNQLSGSTIIFSTSIEGFDDILDIIRSHGVTIGNASNEVPVNRDPNRSQNYPEAFPIKYFNYFKTPHIPQALLLMTAIVVTVVVSKKYSAEVWVPVMILSFSAFVLACYLLFAKLHVQSDGILVLDYPFFKKFYAWNDIGYFRFINHRSVHGRSFTITKTRVLRIHGKDGKLLAEIGWARFLEPLVSVAMGNGIIVLAEAESYGNKSRMVEMHTKLQYTL